jgi:hypothetical protein
MARAHPIAPIVVELACEKRFSIPTGVRPRLRLLRKLALDTIPGLLIDDRDMQAVVDQPLVAKLPDIDRVGEDPIDVAPRDQAAYRSARSGNPTRQSNLLGVESNLQSRTTLPISR